MGLTELTHIASPLLYRAKLLGQGLDEGKSWDYEDQQLAIKTANEIFLFYGVPQREVTADNILAVFKAAITADENSTAKMNSGWTQLASYATHFLEDKPGRIPNIAWNSRVSTSIISRLDFLLVEAGHTSPEKLFPDLGTIPGWGGTRPRVLSLDWPVGYRKWSCQIAASRIVTMIRDTLNSSDNEGNRLYPEMPLPGGDRGRWSVRGVQMILHSDGY